MSLTNRQLQQRSVLLANAAAMLSALALASALAASDRAPERSPQAAARLDPPARPNIVLILADDLGWSDVGAYGGEISTPAIDRLASRGIRFTQFYNSAKCEPTRASLMTGQHWQDVGLDAARGVTMGAALRAAGYATIAVGKWHLAGEPTERGFDHFFGHLSGGSDYFKGDPTHRLDGKPFTPPASGFYTTDANADYAIRFLRETRERDRRPFFLYLAFNAPHAPLQAPSEDIAAYRGRFKAGWDALRQARYTRQRELGVVKPTWALPDRPATIPAWDTLSERDRDAEGLRMAIYAAMVTRMDAAIGRVMRALEELGVAGNTLVMFLSDNGASPFDGGGIGPLGEPSSRWEYGIGWAHLSNTPFRHYKRNMFNGGSCTPFIASWPGVITQHGAIIDAPAHIVDLMPTLIDVAGSSGPPASQAGAVGPLAGSSLRPLLEGKSRDASPYYFQYRNHRAVTADGWKLVSDWGRPWALFDLDADRTETRDLAQTGAARAKALEDRWQRWFDARGVRRLRPEDSEPRYVPIGAAGKRK